MCEVCNKEVETNMNIHAIMQSCPFDKEVCLANSVAHSKIPPQPLGWILRTHELDTIYRQTKRSSGRALIYKGMDDLVSHDDMNEVCLGEAKKEAPVLASRATEQAFEFLQNQESHRKEVISAREHHHPLISSM